MGEKLRPTVIDKSRWGLGKGSFRWNGGRMIFG
jgi:hypothetical protein